MKSISRELIKNLADTLYPHRSKNLQFNKNLDLPDKEGKVFLLLLVKNQNNLLKNCHNRPMVPIAKLSKANQNTEECQLLLQYWKSTFQSVSHLSSKSRNKDLATNFPKFNKTKCRASLLLRSVLSSQLKLIWKKWVSLLQSIPSTQEGSFLFVSRRPEETHYKRALWWHHKLQWAGTTIHKSRTPSQKSSLPKTVSNKSNRLTTTSRIWWIYYDYGTYLNI